jgi:hypothetical protein
MVARWMHPSTPFHHKYNSENCIWSVFSVKPFAIASMPSWIKCFPSS